MTEIIDNFDKWNGTKTIDGLKFNVAAWLKGAEAPINILIPRETYRRLRDYNNIFKLG